MSRTNAALKALIGLQPRTPHVLRAGVETEIPVSEVLTWAFAYNGVGFSLAAGVFYPLTDWQLSPIFAAAVMAFSSVFVVTNSLRLRGTRLDEARKSRTAEAWLEPQQASFQSREGEAAVVSHNGRLAY